MNDRSEPEQSLAERRMSMKTRWILLAISSAVVAAGAVSAQPGAEQLAMSIPAAKTASASVPSTIDAASVRSSIEKSNAEWLAAFRRGDSETLARIYTPDASLFPPTNASLEGRDRIVEYFRTQRRNGMGDANLKTLDVVVVGDVAYEVGTYAFRFGEQEGELGGDTGRYFTIWKSQGDGSWRYQVGIWSSNRDTTLKP
jgi:ketosteroid isomerase-like protein